MEETALDSILEIRQNIPHDYSQIKEIIDLSFPRFYRYFALHSVTSEEGKVLVTETQGVISGFSKLIEFNIATRKYGCILWIAVHPAYRHRGNALNLTNASVDSLKKEGAQTVFASTQRRNKTALSTLSKSGFRRIGFLDLWQVFGWRIFQFYSDIWLAPGEAVLMHTRNRC